MTPDETFYKQLGARLVDRRKELGLTQEKLAGQLGISPQMLASYEVARRRIAVALLPRLCRALAMSAEELIGEAPQRGSRGPESRLNQQMARIQRLPRGQQKFIQRMLDIALQQAEEDADQPRQAED